VKTKLMLFTGILLMLAMTINLGFLGCGGSAKTLTPERQKAIQDSLDTIQKRKVQLKFSLGWERYKQQNYERALPYLRQVAKMDTFNLFDKLLYQSLGTCYLQLNKADSAEYAYKLGVERNPSYAYSYKALAHIYKSTQRYEVASQMYQKVVELEPDVAENWHELGKIYNLMGDLENAKDAYGNAVRLAPTNAQIQEEYGVLLEKMGGASAHFAELEAAKKAIIEQEPDNLQHRIDLAKLYFDNGRYPKAVEQLIIVTEKEPKRIYALELLGESYQQTDQYRKAIDIYNKILAIQPDDKKNMCSLAISYASRGQYRTALNQVQKVIRMDMNFGLAYSTKGYIYETAAEKCLAQKDNKIDFYDKMVYKLAYDEYMKAKKDFNVKEEAERHLNYLETQIPTREDLFMHKNKKLSDAAATCYNTWIR